MRGGSSLNVNESSLLEPAESLRRPLVRRDAEADGDGTGLVAVFADEGKDEYGAGLDNNHTRVIDAPTVSEKAGLRGLCARSKGKRLLLSFALTVLFVRYVVATFLSVFFPLYTERAGIPAFDEGLVMAAYPFGMSVMSILAPRFIIRYGAVACISCGMVASSLLTVGFGFVPDLVGGWNEKLSDGGRRGQVATFFIVYFINGFVGSLADNGAIFLASSNFKEDLGVVMATVGTICGVGCMAGPPIGGLIQSIPPDIEWQFRLPCIVMGTLALTVLVPVVFGVRAGHSTTVGRPDVDGNQGTDIQCEQPGTSRRSTAAMWRLMTKCSFVLTWLAVALSGTAVGTLDPTLAYRLCPDAGDDALPSANTLSRHGTSSHWPYNRFSVEPAVVVLQLSTSLSSRQLLTPTPSSPSRSTEETSVVASSSGRFGLTQSELGLVFMASSVVYVLASIPCGVIVDACKGRRGLFKGLQAAGFAVLAISFALMAPIPLRGLEVTLDASVWWVIGGMLIKGIGSAANNAAYPDLMEDATDATDEVESAAVAGLWNAAYSIGWALGPLLGGLLYGLWGFQGYATAVALGCFTYAIILSCASLRRNPAE